MLTINLALPEAQVRVPDELHPREGEDAVEDGLWLHPEHELQLTNDYLTTFNSVAFRQNILFLSCKKLCHKCNHATADSQTG